MERAELAPSRLSLGHQLHSRSLCTLCFPELPLPSFPRTGKAPGKAPAQASSSPWGKAAALSVEPGGEDSSHRAVGKEAAAKWTRGLGSRVSTVFLQASSAPLLREDKGACGKGVQVSGRMQAEHSWIWSHQLWEVISARPGAKQVYALCWPRRNGNLCATGTKRRAGEDGRAQERRGEQPWLPSSGAAPSWRGQQKVPALWRWLWERDRVRGNRDRVPL